MSSKSIKGRLMKKVGRKEYVDYSTIVDSTIHTYFILGHRGDGKTYGALELVKNEYWKTGIPSAYIRRLDDSILPSELGDLMNPFSDKIMQDSNNVFNEYNYRSKKFYPVFSDYGKVSKRGKPIIHAGSLNTWQNSKGADRGQIRYFILDEAIDEKQYLKNEVKAFKNTMSTFVRDRSGTDVIILANPLNPYCPYFDHYGIEIEKMKQGEITDIRYENGEIMRFVWLPESKGDIKSMATGILNAGKTTQSITTGAWDVGQFRLFDADVVAGCEELYTVLVLFARQYYLFTAMYANDVPIDGTIKHLGLFYKVECVVDYTKEPDLFITDKSLPLPYQCKETYAFFPKNSITDDMVEAFRNNGVYYGDNKTGSAIEQWLKVVVSKRGALQA